MEYIEKLRRGVSRHLATPHVFVVVRPPEHLRGWWKKLAVLQPGRFTGRVMYLDLDTVVVGPLDELVQHKGAVHLADWGWARNVHAGGLWIWDAGDLDDVYRAFGPEVERRFENDQEWLTTLNVFAPLPKGICVSYRYHCKNGPPPGASLVAFHGKPKPHEATEGWVKEEWT